MGTTLYNKQMEVCVHSWAKQVLEPITELRYFGVLEDFRLAGAHNTAVVQDMLVRYSGTVNMVHL